jgi:Na+/citrate or Na+/malate symporter
VTAELVNAFTFTNLLVIVSTVSALVATGFLVGKKIGTSRLVKVKAFTSSCHGVIATPTAKRIG